MSDSYIRVTPETTSLALPLWTSTSARADVTRLLRSPVYSAVFIGKRRPVAGSVILDAGDFPVLGAEQKSLDRTDSAPPRPKRHSRFGRSHCPGQVEALKGFDDTVLAVAVAGSAFSVGSVNQSAANKSKGKAWRPRARWEA